MVYKDLQKKTYPYLHLKQYTPPSQVKHALHTQPGVTYAPITKHSYAAINIEQDQHIYQPLQQTSDIQDFKNMMKSLFEQMGTMLNLLITVLTKLK
jgi:hypothetical protein